MIGRAGRRRPRVLSRAQVRAARLAGRYDLLVGAKVGLGEPDLRTGTHYLALVTLGKSLVHWLTSGCFDGRRS